MSTFPTWSSCCVVQQFSVHSLFLVLTPLQAMDTPRTTNANRAHRFLYRGNNNNNDNKYCFVLFCFVFSWGHGDHHGSDVFSVLSFYCAWGLELMCLLNWHGSLCITTVSCPVQEKVAVNVPQIRSAALSMYCNLRNVCISKNEIFGILPLLKLSTPGDSSPSSCDVLWENGLLSLQVSGAHLQKKKLSGWGLFLWKKPSPEKHFHTIPFQCLF